MNSTNPTNSETAANPTNSANRKLRVARGVTNSENSVPEAARAVTRPIVTVMFAGALTGLAIEGADPPPWFLGLAIPCVTWWFGERFLQRRKEEK